MSQQKQQSTPQVKPPTATQGITDDLDALLDTLPPRLARPLRQNSQHSALLEVVLDLGRLPEARCLDREVVLDEHEVAEEDIAYVVARIGDFGEDNRAGIPRTLHRISAMRNRKGKIVGLTCRVGRAVYGTIDIILDIVQSGKSLLLLGRPGVGKTTMLREAARVLAETRRVVIVDTSNEIAGDGDIPHPAIGRARRMQVTMPTLQHEVMIEAVENHMPEVIIIDEIGRELEATAARTIAERGVQLIGTAHGNTLENIMQNPTLCDLIGGIQAVTLGDEEAKRRGTQKTVLERKAPPTFDIIVEIQDWQRLAVHQNVAETVDSILRGMPLPAELRYRDETGAVQRVEEKLQFRPTRERASREGPVFERVPFEPRPAEKPPVERAAPGAAPKPTRIYPYGVSQNRLEQVAQEMKLPVVITRQVGDADLVMTLKNYYRKKPQALREAESAGVPIYVLRSNSAFQIEHSLANIFSLEVELGGDPMSQALAETEEAIQKVLARAEPVELAPQNAYIRRLQHQMANQAELASKSLGRDPHRRVQIYKGEK
jgi:stage III sporulation protein SpoIIIAA